MEDAAHATGYAGRSSWQNYEDIEFYPGTLPFKFIQRIAPVFIERGIPDDEIWSLCGAKPNQQGIISNPLDQTLNEVAAALDILIDRRKIPISRPLYVQWVLSMTAWAKNEKASGRDPSKEDMIFEAAQRLPDKESINSA